MIAFDLMSFLILLLFVFWKVDFAAMKNITMKIIITIPTFDKRLFYDILFWTNHVLDTANTNSRLQYMTVISLSLYKRCRLNFKNIRLFLLTPIISATHPTHKLGQIKTFRSMRKWRWSGSFFIFQPQIALQIKLD